MIITVASFKGGVAKTTTAVHIATYLNQSKTTLLIDGDPNRSVTGWSKRGTLPFKVIDERQAARYARDFEHIVIDTQARPSPEDLEALAGGCDLLVVPTTPDAMALDALLLMVDTLKSLGTTRVPGAHHGGSAQAESRRRGGPRYASRSWAAAVCRWHPPTGRVPEGRSQGRARVRGG